MKELPKVYEPQQVESSIYEMWMENDCFKATPDPDKKPYSIVMPPPNVTGQLHMGHALDATLQDILTSITKDVADLPDTETTALTKDNFEYFAFTAMPDGVEAIDADALINAAPHSVVLMRAQDAETAKQLAADVEGNLNPAKWVCVEAEKTAVLVHNCTVLLALGPGGREHGQGPEGRVHGDGTHEYEPAAPPPAHAGAAAV